MKALHLRPFWAAAQRERDALGVVIYRPKDLAADVVQNCQSHFVLRRDHDGLFVDGERTNAAGASAIASVPAGSAVVVRYGSAAVGIRVPWTRSQDGSPSDVRLFDDQRYGAMRLTIDHHRAPAPVQAGAALWVRVATGLENDQQFHDWRAAFESAEPICVQATDESVQIEIPGHGGSVRVSAAQPFGAGQICLAPQPSTGTLEIDGKELGRPLLEPLECIRQHLQRAQASGTVRVPPDAGIYWEAESGLIFPGMDEGKDENASGGRYLWHRPQDTWGRNTSTAAWTLSVAEAGRYYLWGRVLAPDPETDSFYISIRTDTRTLLPRSEWHTRSSPDWRWTPVTLNRAKEPAVFDVPEGSCRIQLTAREAGTKIDRLFLTRSPNEVPADPDG
jgi:hypothetical protein